MKHSGTVVLTGLICFLFISTITSAQPRGRMSVKDRVTILKDSLSLSSNQVIKITAILEKTDTLRRNLFEQSDGDRDAMREKMMSLMQETDTKIEALLTPEQKKKYDVIKQQRRQRMGQPRGERPNRNQ